MHLRRHGNRSSLPPRGSSIVDRRAARSTGEEHRHADQESGRRGLRTDGARHRAGRGAGGLAGRRCGDRTEGLDAGIARIEKSLAKLAEKAAEKGQKTIEQARGEADATRIAHPPHARARRARGLRPGDRGDRRGPRREEGALRQARGDLQARDDPRLEYLVLPDRRDGRRFRPAGPHGRPALLQPGAAHEAGRGGPHAEDRGRSLRQPRAPSARPAGKCRSPARTRRASWSIVSSSPSWSQALQMLERGDATKEDIDAAMQSAAGIRWVRSP